MYFVHFFENLNNYRPHIDTDYQLISFIRQSYVSRQLFCPININCYWYYRVELEVTAHLYTPNGFMLNAIPTQTNGGDDESIVMIANCVAGVEIIEE